MSSRAGTRPTSIGPMDPTGQAAVEALISVLDALTLHCDNMAAPALDFLTQPHAPVHADLAYLQQPETSCNLRRLFECHAL